MKVRFALVALVSVVLAAACLPKTDQADGSSCAKDSECKSSRCFEGFCAGSSCKPSDSSSCEEGWKCTHSGPDPITGFFGSDGSDTCSPTCGHCPGNSHCPKDAPAGAICSFGKEPLELAVAVENAIAGRPVKLTASAKNGSGILVECSWDLGDGKSTEKTNGPVLVRIIRDAHEYRAHVSCTDDAGGRGAVETTFTVTCTPSGEACVEGACCGATNQRCVAGECKVPSPPMLAIEGPTTVALHQSVTFTAKMLSGDGTLRDATWKFADDAPFPKQGLSVEHAFDMTGDIAVQLNAATDLLTQGETTIVVKVTE
jgi:hypothetical protein